MNWDSWLESVLRGPQLLIKAGPYIGPRGGKWADPQHTIPWKESGERERKEKERPKYRKYLYYHSTTEELYDLYDSPLSVTDDSDASAEYLRDQDGYQYLIAVPANLKLATDDEIEEAADRLHPDHTFSHAWEMVERLPGIQESLARQGYDGIEIQDVTPNNRSEHKTITVFDAEASGIKVVRGRELSADGEVGESIPQEDIDEIGKSLQKAKVAEGQTAFQFDAPPKTIKPKAKAGGPFIGPRGGKWKDPQHTIPWKEGEEAPKAKPKRTSMKGRVKVPPRGVVTDAWLKHMETSFGKVLDRAESATNTAELSEAYAKARDYSHKVRQDLLYARGMFLPVGPSKDEKSHVNQLAAKLQEAMVALDERLQDAVSNAGVQASWSSGAQRAARGEAVGGLFEHPGEVDLYRRFVKEYGSHEAWQKHVVSQERDEASEPGIKKAMKAVMSAARGIKKDRMGFKSLNQEFVQQFTLGRMTVHYSEHPQWGSRKLPVQMTAEQRKLYQNPLLQKELVEAGRMARSWLEQKGLGGLWRGSLEIGATKQEGRVYDANAKEWKTVDGAAFYISQTDKVQLHHIYYRRPRTVAKYMAHELGHRMWFKGLTNTQREEFTANFGKIAATSRYGGNNPEEDFAEVFMEYVSGGDLTRDQLERFKAVMRIKKSLQPDLLKAKKPKTAAGQMGLFDQPAKPKPAAKPAARGGPFIGPRGGKWADPQHTIPWEDTKPAKPKILVVKKDPKTGKETVITGKPKAKPKPSPKWDRVGDEYHMELEGGRRARLFKDGKAWFLEVDGERHKLPPKASFDHAEGLLSELEPPPPEKRAPQPPPPPEVKPEESPREKAAGILAARLNTLEREGWKVVPAKPGMRPSDTEILGPLPGAKVKQLLDAGVTLVREKGRRYEDVGEKIGGARKDIAALARMSREELERDPSAAYKLVTRDNTLGKWGLEHLEADRAAGLPAEVSMLKRGILQSVATRPPDTADDRDRFREGCHLLQKSLARVESVQDVKDMLAEWYDAARGRKPAEVVERDSEMGQQLLRGFKEKEGVGEAEAYFELEKQGIVGYQLAPDGKIRAVREDKAAGEQRQRMVMSLGPKFAKMANLEIKKSRGITRLYAVPAAHLRLYRIEHASKHRQKVFDEAAKTKSYEAMVLLAGKPKGKPRGSTKVEREEGKEGVRVWQRKLGVVERVGLPDIPAGADGQQIMGDLGVRAVEYGNWASDDERQWHTEMAHAGLHDLAGVLGIPAQDIAVKGRLALAFGARGKGGKRAGAAHYEPDKRVINLTKMKGNGSLAHEWGHFLDHAVMLALRPEQGKPVYVSGKAGLMPDVPQEIRQAIGRVMRTIKFTRRSDAEVAQIAKKRAALRAELDTKRAEIRRMPAGSPETNREIDAFNAKVREVNALKVTHRADSEHYAAAQERGAYWAKDVELFARAFESYVEDRLHSKGQRSSYLVDGTRDLDPANYKGAYLMPDDPHRAQINAAMDGLMAELREQDRFRKSMLVALG